MTKLEIVRHALETNPKVVILSMHEENYLPNRHGYWSHTLDYWAAPKKGIYTAKKLQDFMTGLIPGLQPTCADEFRQSSQSLEFGKLYFDEQIGSEQITRICTLTDPLMFHSQGFEEGKRTIIENQEYMRRTWVRLFPDQEIAKDILEGKLDGEYHISMAHLKEYQPSLLQCIQHRKF
jgi:hypothetical protein